ncbi:Pimeloyl-ACP methyl ester carboxylesterase [Ohtaekwangia koreensis]|uniref:Pimeloyl-ACP methyl ester carboxylesterase n=2 Tax=Ohtaekwangia koreensis TaxID=688867 RepID=A0A1T5JQT6_9BACT|nr:Pimeloyl-ACP methyl ester carboxylesterase [Ohtaekwangia koreensis]
MNFKNVKTQSVNIGGTEFFYRKLGESNSGIPIIFLNHLSATMDDCDPRIIDGLASEYSIICFDNRGIGSTEGTTPKTVAEMATDAIAFIKALGYQKVDLFGFSLGGFVSQEILLREPQLVRKAILAGTGPAEGEAISKMTPVVIKDVIKGKFTFRNEKFYLFFNRNANGRKAAKSYLGRLKERKENKDKALKMKHLTCQLDAIKAWGLQAPQDLSVIKQPILIVNGENDKMVPINNSYELKKRIKNSELIIYKDAGHGSIFQNHEDFVKKSLAFLAE